MGGKAAQFLAAQQPVGLEALVLVAPASPLRGSAAAKLAWPTSAAHEDISDRVRDINVPTLILAGDQDRQDPLHQQQTEVLPRIPAARLEVVRESGHLSPIDQPGQLAEAIRAFLSH